MLRIQKISSRDVQALEDHFTEKEQGYFENVYLEQLQDRCLGFIALTKDAEGHRHYFAYASLWWESDYTQFWRRNIPEITDLYVTEKSRKQSIGTQLIAACEIAAQEKRHSKIGISVAQDDKALKAYYEKLAYVADGFALAEGDSQYHLVKVLLSD